MPDRPNRSCNQALPGLIVAESSDGWTLHQLTTREQAASEGKVMNHAVEHYFKYTSRKANYYSLRDPEGYSHTTFDVLDPAEAAHRWGCDRESVSGAVGTLVGYRNCLTKSDVALALLTALFQSGFANLLDHAKNKIKIPDHGLPEVPPLVQI